MTKEDAEGDAVIWDRARPARKGPRPAHTLADITDAAVSLADRKGLAAVSIRAVATELDTGGASLYRYIVRKDDLHDLMVDAVFAEYALPDSPSGDWNSDLGLLAHRGRAVYHAHPWMAELAPHASWGPSTQNYMEFFLSALTPTGLDLPASMEFITLMHSWIASFVQLEGQAMGAPSAAKVRHFATIAADPARPHLARAITSLMQADPSTWDPDQLFERGLHRLLYGIADQQRARPTRGAAGTG
ncbi:TetR/AcrR family transcriptional regulator [Georgenia subflava]|uniref:TetR family transcriptional regulator n=1 Tax=Georgenia subflava TaxID=1622177 RepID=A0A6N7EIC5_9MICO|nr:TetR/AcrR family transcriptional regulator [Georgenia subflava]MPV35906.1 TetR family transcriptional regulator [Georgenia subflava]